MKKYLILALRALSEASFEILKFYKDGFELFNKYDHSPLTSADQASHKIICDYLEKTSFPILSEEGEHYAYEIRKNWETYWLLDPIDGTLEFIKKSDQFCISLALIKEKKPVMGIIFAPRLNLFYFASKDMGAYKFEGDLRKFSNILASSTKDLLKEIIKNSLRLPFEKPNIYTLIRSPYESKKTDFYQQELKKLYPDLKVKKMASALKMAFLAQGKANEYKRFSPMFEWDLAAGHAILLYAGCKIERQDENQEILYNNPDMKIGCFRACLSL